MSGSYLEGRRDRLHAVHELRHLLLLRVAADAEGETHFLADILALPVRVESRQYLDAVSDSATWKRKHSHCRKRFLQCLINVSWRKIYNDKEMHDMDSKRD